MTDRKDAARGADVLGRWRSLAEQRLDYLTELFESGRWRRFYDERAFLENIREAKAAVDAWRALSTLRAAPERGAIRVTWSIAARELSPAIAPDETPVELALLDEPVPDLATVAQRYPLLRNRL